MKIKCYDKYHQQWVYIEPAIGRLYYSHRNDDGKHYKTILRFSAVEGDKDSCSPERWSDLEQFEVV